MLRDVVAFGVSPDGRHVAFVECNAKLESDTYDCTLQVIESKLHGALTRLGSVSPALSVRSGWINRRIHWTRDGMEVTYISNFDGLDQVWAWRIDGGAPRKLSHADAGVVSQAVLPDGRLLFTTFGINASPAKQMALAKQAREQGMIFTAPVQARDYQGEQGIQRYVARVSGGKFEHWVVDLERGGTSEVTQQDLQAYAPGFPGWDEIDGSLQRERGLFEIPPRPLGASDMVQSPDGRRVAIVSQELRAGQREQVIRVGSPDDAQRDTWYRMREGGVSALHWSSTSGHLYFYQHHYTDGQGPVSGIYRIGAAGSEPEPVFTTTDAVSAIAYDDAGDAAVFLLSGATQPPRIVRFSFADRHLRALYDPNAGLAEKRLGSPRLLTWTNEYGVKAFGRLVEPVGRESGKKYPLVIVTYRAQGFLRGGTGDEYPIYPLATAGFAVLALDAGEAYFSSADGDDFSVYSRWWSALATVKKALEQLEPVDWIDHSRRAITGLSYGADTAWYILSHSNLFRAAIVSDGGFDSYAFYCAGIGSTNRSQRDLWSTFRVPVLTAAQRARWEHVGVSGNAMNLRAPILINDSDNEFGCKQGALTTLTGLGKPFELIVYPSAGHIINSPAQRYSIYNRNIDWLRFWLMNEEDASPGKAEQYARWRRLKQQHEWNEQMWARGQDPSVEFARQTDARSFGKALDEAVLAPMLR